MMLLNDLKRLIKLEKEIIEVLNKHLIEYNEPVMIDLIKPTDKPYLA